MKKISMLLFLLLSLVVPVLYAGNCTVDATTTNQYIHCIGASSAWSGIGSMGTALFADDNVNGHLGLSSLRARIDPNNSFSSEVNTLKQAQAVNSSVLCWATEWSPPAQYKANNNVNGGASNDTFLGAESGSPNSADTGLASYQVSFIQYCKNQGVNLYALSIQNEPNFNPTYEACLWTAGQFNVYAQAFHSAIASAGLSTKIMLPEPDNTYGMNLATTAMDDATTSSYISIIGTHLYGTGNPGTLSSYGYTHVTNQEYWETEISGNTTDMPGALQEAGWIQNSLVGANMNAFHYWWLTDLISNNSFTIKAYVLGNYSKFIRPGYYRMGATASPTSGVAVSAFKDTNNSSPSKIVFVAINNNGSATNQTFNLNGLNVTSVTPWITDSSHNLVALSAASVSGNSFTYSLPASSVVSFVGTNNGTGPTSTNTPIVPTATSTPCVSTAITPYIQVNGGAWTQTNAVSVTSLPATVNLGPQPATGGSWSWSGPNGFNSTSREIDGIALSAGTNVYTATYTNACGAKSTQAFTITAPASTATNTPVPPTNTFTYTKTNTPVPPTNTPTYTYTKTNTPIPPTSTPTTPIPTNTPIVPTSTPTTPIPTNTPIVPTSTPITPIPTNTPIVPTSTPTTPIPTNTPIVPTSTPTTPIPTNTPIVPTSTPTTPVPTNTPIVPTFTPTVPPASGTLTVYLLSSVTTDSTNSPHPQIEVKNTGTGALNLNNVEVRYWINCDCTGQSVQAWVDWAGLLPAGTSVTGNIQTAIVPTSLGGQTNYISYRFTGNMILQPGQIIQIQGRFNLSDWSNMLQSNDWSYAAYTSFTASSKITGYISGGLVWGSEPASASSQTALVSNVMTYPNPATSSTGATLKYSVSTGSGVSASGIHKAGTSDAVSIPVSGNIRLGIYSISGRLIWQKNLDDVSFVSAGEHAIHWDGKSAGGKNLAAGTYILKVTLQSSNGSNSGYSTIIMLK